jgi:integrase/recombinase XerC
MYLASNIDNSTSNSLSIHDHFRRYEAWLWQQPFSRSTKRNYAAQVRLYLNFVRHFPTESAIALEQRDFLIEKYRAYLHNSNDARPSSINQSHTAIDNFYQFLGLGPSTIEREKSAQKLPRVLTPGELDGFINALDTRGSTKERAVILLFLSTGIRLNECASLDVQDVSITAHTGKVTVRKRDYVCERELSLDEITRRALLAWLIERVKFAHERGFALFVNSKGQRLSHSALDQIVRKIGIQARMILSAQVLRDTFLAGLAQRSQDIFLVTAMGGCKSLESAKKYFQLNRVDSASNM